MFCIKGTYDIDNHAGKCPETCEYGHWNNWGVNMKYGVGCGAECLASGGTLYVVENDEIYCDGCGCIEKFDWDCGF